MEVLRPCSPLEMEYVMLPGPISLRVILFKLLYGASYPRPKDR